MFTDDQISDGKRWFIMRFIHTSAGQSFALREHKLEAGAKIKSHVRVRNERYDIAFIVPESRDMLFVSPRTDAAKWCYGYLLSFGGQWVFVSRAWTLEQNSLLALSLLEPESEDNP